MSYNLSAKGTFEGDGVTYEFRMSRFLPGITHSGHISQGDIIRFPNGVQVEIEYIIHDWRPFSSDISPNSTAYGLIDRALNKEEFLALKEYGFDSYVR